MKDRKLVEAKIVEWSGYAALFHRLFEEYRDAAKEAILTLHCSTVSAYWANEAIMLRCDLIRHPEFYR